MEFKIMLPYLVIDYLFVHVVMGVITLSQCGNSRRTTIAAVHAAVSNSQTYYAPSKFNMDVNLKIPREFESMLSGWLLRVKF